MKTPLAILAACFVASCGDPAEPAEPAVPIGDALRERLFAASPLPPLPPDPTNAWADDPAAARFGQALFYDERLSANGEVSCATCHQPTRGFTDGERLAVGLSVGTRKTPTLWNAAHQRWLTWDGRADSLWMQALDPIEDTREMGTTRVDVLRVIAGDAGLRADYEATFGALPEGVEQLPSARPARRGEAESGDDAPEPVTRWAALDDATRESVTRAYTNVGKSLAAYQRRLVRGDAPFDRFVEGLRDGDATKLAAMSVEAQRGLALFFGRANCTLCHSGPLFSDGEFHNNALPTHHGGEPVDAGRYEGAAVVKASPFNAGGPFSDATDDERARQVRTLRVSSETWGEFRTPSLRNLAGRAPFMHQGQFETLADVVAFYDTLEPSSGRSHHQERILVPLGLTEADRSDLAAFLRSLEGAPADESLLGPPSPR